MKTQTMRTWAEINLGNIRYNINSIRASLPEKTGIVGVVKADAYGHGAIQVAKAELDAGVSYLAVAALSEAIELREAGITAPILILGVTPVEYANELCDYGITQAVSGLQYAVQLSEAVEKPLKVHMKLDTGMSRTGFNAVDPDKFADIAEALSLPKLEYEGVFTHFATSDVVGDPFAGVQFERFRSTVERIESVTPVRFKLKHCANSGAVLNCPEFMWDMVRPGIISYGLFPDKEHGPMDLRPAMQLKSRVYAITDHVPGDTVSYGRHFEVTKPLRIAVVPIGYADGLHRVLSGKIDMLIRGKRCHQLGNICMDMCMVDITNIPECRVGDIVTVFGTDGDEEISADELADKAGTINYEITCAVSKRVPRIYL